jgi:hypothetical protein
MSFPEDLLRVAKRVVWFQSPENTLSNTTLFLAHVMTYGTLEDIVTAMKHYPDSDFQAVLNAPPVGVFDKRSWTYWNLYYHHTPVPPLPQRSIPGVEPATLPASHVR